MPPVTPSLAGPQPVEVYIEYALDQNPDVRVARKRIEAAAERVPQAASLKDPTLGVTAYPSPVQTAAGEQQLSLNASQQFPWLGKLDTQASVAEEETNVARAQLAVVELEVIEQVKRAYYELYFIQKAIGITEHDKTLLMELSAIAESKYRTGAVSQQDVLRAQVEVSNLESQLIRLRQELESAQAHLARLLHVSPDTPVRALERLPPEHAPQDLDRLYQQAIAARPELQVQLAALRRDRQSVELARLNYYPDLTASVIWNELGDYGLSPVANGRDSVGIGVSMNVPLYRKRLDAGIRGAEAQATATARQYDSVRDRTAAEVKDLFVQANSQTQLIRLFRDDIIPKAGQTLQVSMSAYQVGKIGFLQLIDNWRELLRFQIMYQRLESQLQQTLASLDRVVGGQLQLEAAEPTSNTAGSRPPAPAELPPIPPSPDQPSPGKP